MQYVDSNTAYVDCVGRSAAFLVGDPIRSDAASGLCAIVALAETETLGGEGFTIGVTAPAAWLFSAAAYSGAAVRHTSWGGKTGR